MSLRDAVDELASRPGGGCVAPVPIYSQGTLAGIRDAPYSRVRFQHVSSRPRLLRLLQVDVISTQARVITTRLCGLCKWLV